MNELEVMMSAASTLKDTDSEHAETKADLDFSKITDSLSELVTENSSEMTLQSAQPIMQTSVIGPLKQSSPNEKVLEIECDIADRYALIKSNQHSYNALLALVPNIKEEQITHLAAYIRGETTTHYVDPYIDTLVKFHDVSQQRSVGWRYMSQLTSINSSLTEFIRSSHGAIVGILQNVTNNINKLIQSLKRK